MFGYHYEELRSKSMQMPAKPTESELSILQILWALERATVRTVNETLNETALSPIGYTTTLKLMQIMTEKGLVQRDTSSRTHVYRAAIPQATVRNGLVSGLVDKVFGGSASQLVLQALGNHRATPAELAEIKSLIARLEDEQE